MEVWVFAVFALAEEMVRSARTNDVVLHRAAAEAALLMQALGRHEMQRECIPVQGSVQGSCGHNAWCAD